MTKIAPTDRAEIVRRHGAGESAASIAREFGCSTATVQYHLRKAGVPTAGPAIPPEQLPELIARYNAGESVGEIARDLSFSSASLRRAFIRAGLQLRFGGSASKLSPAESEELVRRYVAGESTTALTSAFDLCPTTVEAYVKRAGVSLRPAARSTRYGFTPEQIANMAARYQVGESVAQIARAFRCSWPTAAHHLRQFGIQVAAPRSKVDLEAAARMYRQGATSVEVAKAFGVARQTAERYLKRAGVELRPPGFQLKHIVLAEFRQGLNPHEIATKLDITVEQVLDPIRAVVCRRQTKGMERSHDRA